MIYEKKDIIKSIKIKLKRMTIFIWYVLKGICLQWIWIVFKMISIFGSLSLIYNSILLSKYKPIRKFDHWLLLVAFFACFSSVGQN